MNVSKTWIFRHFCLPVTEVCEVRHDSRCGTQISPFRNLSEHLAATDVK